MESFLSQKICVSCYEKLIQMDDFRKLCIRSDIFLKQEIGIFENNTENELIQFISTAAAKSSPIKQTTTTSIDKQQKLNNSDCKINNKDSNLKVYKNKNNSRLQENKIIGTKNYIRNNVKIEPIDIHLITLPDDELINHKLTNTSKEKKMPEDHLHEAMIEILTKENKIGDKTFKYENTKNQLLVKKTEICAEADQEQQNGSKDNQKTILLKIDKMIEEISGKHNSKIIAANKNTINTKTNTKNKKSANLMPCHICGKFTEPSKYKYHLNMHNGIFYLMVYFLII